MAPTYRDIILGNIWANGASDPPPSPVIGTTYRRSILTSSEIADAWPFKEIVESDKFNEFMLRLSTIVSDVEAWGIPPWSSLIDYDVSALVMGSDGDIYRSFVSSNQNNDPVSTPTAWKLAFLASDGKAVDSLHADEANNADTVDGYHAADLIAAGNPFSTVYGTVSKTSGVNYVNGSRTRIVVISTNAPGGLPNGYLGGYINGVLVNAAQTVDFNGAWADTQVLTFMVPPGATYRTDWIDNTGSIQRWYEAD